MGGKKRERNYYSDGTSSDSSEDFQMDILDKYRSLVYDAGNTIYFLEEVNVVNIQKFIRLVEHKLKDKDYNEEINLTYIVNSGGGSTFDKLLFVDFIRLTKKKYPNLKFTSVATGAIASAATTMCLIADERLITSNTTSMIHELQAGISRRTITHIKSTKKMFEMLHKDCINIYMEHINKDENGNPKTSREELELLLLKETYYTADEYVKAGFADRVIE